MEQLNLFEAKAGRDAGIKKAIDNATAKIPGWDELAYQFLLTFIKDHSEVFMAEDVRLAAHKARFPEPPNPRAWGSIFVRASKEGKIKNLGFGKKRGADAHCTPSIRWEPVKQAA
jgi:hypothetical protein